MKKKFVLIMLVLSSGVTVNGQFHVPKKELADLVTSKTLVVRLLDDDKLTKVGSGFNTLLEEYVRKYWKSNTNIKFASGDEADKLFEDGSVALLKTYEGSVKAGNVVYKSVQWFVLKVKNEKGKAKAVMSVSHGAGEFTVVDMRFIIEQFNRYVEAGKKELTVKDVFNVEKNLALLKKRTFLIPEEGIEISPEEAKSCYGLKSKIVKYDYIKNVLDEEKEGYLYLISGISARKSSPMIFLVDSKDHMVVGIMSLGGVHVYLRTGETTSKKMFSWTPTGLKCVHLKGFRQKFAQKMNN